MIDWMGLRRPPGEVRDACFLLSSLRSIDGLQASGFFCF